MSASADAGGHEPLDRQVVVGVEGDAGIRSRRSYTRGGRPRCPGSGRSSRGSRARAARSSSFTRACDARGCVAGRHTYIGSSSRCTRSTPSGRGGHRRRVDRQRDVAVARLQERGRPRRARPARSVSSTPGCASRKRPIAFGMIVAPAEGNAASRSRPERRPAMASSSASASASRERMTSVWRSSAVPGVGQPHAAGVALDEQRARPRARARRSAGRRPTGCRRASRRRRRRSPAARRRAARGGGGRRA